MLQYVLSGCMLCLQNSFFVINEPHAMQAKLGWSTGGYLLSQAGALRILALTSSGITSHVDMWLIDNAVVCVVPHDRVHVPIDKGDAERDTNSIRQFLNGAIDRTNDFVLP